MPWLPFSGCRNTAIGFAWRSTSPSSSNSVSIAWVLKRGRHAGHRDAVDTIKRLSEYCSWFRMEEHVTEFVKQSLHCLDSKAGEKVPRPLEETVHGTRPGEVVHFDYLYVGASGPLGDDGLDDNGRFRFILMMDNMSNWVYEVVHFDYLCWSKWAVGG